jgi:tetraacyldisaccharide 4'-kinase
MYQSKLSCIGQAGSGKELAARDLKGKKMVLFSGIGDHLGFVRQIGKAGIEILDDVKFSDHYSYTQADLKGIADRVTKKGGDGALTTEKDFVRLSGDRLIFDEFVKQIPLYYAGIAVDIIEGRVILHSMIEKCLTGSAA